MYLKYKKELKDLPISKWSYLSIVKPKYYDKIHFSIWRVSAYHTGSYGNNKRHWSGMGKVLHSWVGTGVIIGSLYEPEKRLRKGEPFTHYTSPRWS